ncbi:unnamed protein product [Larinioides sclopetarius]|uniref:Methyltransferase type 11 domain-containing protein n=1 Tax=Larinioides sclopetarius TaxID=280406 RepID=A0AAV1Z2Q7_9ARAC
MEFIIYTAVTIIAWTLSLTWLLPFVIILKFSKTCRDKWYSWLLVKVTGPLLNAVVSRQRKNAFNILKKHLGDRKRKTPLEILEIGVGGGANLPFYPDNSNLTALDMNESFVTYLEETLQKCPQVTCKKIVIAMAEDMHEIENDSFDVVVCTLVLCSVKNIQSVLKEARRVLKPGGKFLFLEHVIYADFTWNAVLQSLINPLWNIYFNGCNLNRKTDEEIRKAGFSDTVIEKQYPKGMWMFLRPRMIGIATK